MKKVILLLAFLFLIMCMLVMSCGPGKKLLNSESKVDKLQKDSTNTHSQLNDCNAKVKNLLEATTSLRNEYTLAQNDLKVLSYGNVYVALEEKLLFKSGSAVVDPKGKEALKSLAIVLNNTKDITVMIEGHTDNVPIKTSMFKDNWDLSTGRAISILRILTNDYGFDSNRITASGRGQFHPVKTNDTVEGRAGNRRTEIILSPDLKEIYKLLYQ